MPTRAPKPTGSVETVLRPIITEIVETEEDERNRILSAGVTPGVSAQGALLPAQGVSAPGDDVS
jgi:hypothetical protein